MTETDYTTRELMTCVLAERLRDGEVMIVGGASPIPMAAGLLAQRTHAPNLTLLTGSGAVNPRPKFLAESGGDHAYVKSAEAYYTMDDVFDHTERGVFDVSIFGGVQVDAYGNFNLTHVGGTLKKPKLRGPGFVNAGLPLATGRFMLSCERHDSTVFVDQLSFASGAGTRRPDGSPYPETRRGSGPDFCVTSLATLDFNGPGDRMRLVTVHRGLRAEDVAAQTGFALALADDLPPTPDPDPDVLALLRRSIDPTGVLRSGAERG